MLGGLIRKRALIVGLKPTDLVIRQGEVVGVVGESGSGKSTLARCIARFVRPSAGEILLGGAEIAVSAKARCGRIGGRCR